MKRITNSLWWGHNHLSLFSRSKRALDFVLRKTISTSCLRRPPPSTSRGVPRNNLSPLKLQRLVFMVVSRIPTVLRVEAHLKRDLQGLKAQIGSFIWLLIEFNILTYICIACVLEEACLGVSIALVRDVQKARFISRFRRTSPNFRQLMLYGSRLCRIACETDLIHSWIWFPADDICSWRSRAPHSALHGHVDILHQSDT
jgi:hypothetical protein